MHRNQFRRGAGTTAKYLLAAVLAITLVFPIYILFLSSFKTPLTIFDFRLVPRLEDLTFGSYSEVFATQSLERNIANSFIVSTVVTVVSLIFHSMCAYPLARLSFPGRRYVFGIILSTMMIPFAVNMVPLFIIVKNMGLVNSLWGIILPCIPHAWGVFLLRQFFYGIPVELEESAWMDGLSYFGTYARIVLPLSKPILVTLAVSYFLYNWNNYLWPLIIAQKRELWLVQVAIANFKGEHSVSWNLILAASCIAALPTLILFFIFQRYIVDGIKTTGIKM